MSTALANQKTEALYAEIGQHLADAVPSGFTRALAYAECEQGAAGCDVFVELDGTARFMFAPQALTDAFYALWQAQSADQEAWRAAVFTLAPDGKFKLDYVYADRFDEELDTTERREPILHGFFGQTPIDYEPM